MHTLIRDYETGYDITESKLVAVFTEKPTHILLLKVLKNDISGPWLNRTATMLLSGGSSFLGGIDYELTEIQANTYLD